MWVQSTACHRRPQANADINMVPLIDIMLVLVIVFLVTAPLLTRAVRIDLPREDAPPVASKTASISLSIDQAGQLFWEREPLDWKQLDSRLRAISRTAPTPEIHIQADREIAYKHVMRLMSAVGSAGLTRIGFVTEPVHPH